jgi:beta-glucosidase
MLKDVKAGMITCNGVAATGTGNFPGAQQQTAQPETPFEVAYDYFHIISKGLK